MIQDKTNCSVESIQQTESTNLNIFRIFLQTNPPQVNQSLHKLINDK